FAAGLTCGRPFGPKIGRPGTRRDFASASEFFWPNGPKHISDAGTTDLVFTVTRTGGPSLAFTVDYDTTNNTATAVGGGSVPTFHRLAIDATVYDPQSLFADDMDSDDDLDSSSACPTWGTHRRQRKRR
ncbi:MAG TPA: hypothetical protein VIY86_04750, partial [Pirellulaceae bacterium]